MADRFPSPFEIETPPGAEGWQDLYAYSLPFSEDRREYEDSMFWFLDGIHWSQVFPPFDATFLQYAIASLSQYNTRHYIIPPALGVDYRVLNGYAYLAPVPVADPADIEARIPHFVERAGYYYANWDDLYEKWMVKARDVIDRLEAVEFEPLPDMVDMEIVTSGKGRSNGFDLLESYNTLMELGLELWQYHFEFLNLGYAAYLDYFGFCKEAFPGIPDLSIAKMVAGIDVDLFRPDQEIRRLAQLAVDLGVDDALAEGTAAEALARVAEVANGPEWLAEWEKAKDPWFNYSNGSGFYHTDSVWMENLDIPMSFLRGYIGRVKAGDDINPPIDEVIAERDRIADEYTSLLEGEDAETFAQKLGLARTVFHYVENHNFYVEHWGHSVFWRKMRQLGDVFVKEGFFAETDDVFMLQRDEIPSALWDMYSAWAVGTEARGPKYWSREIPRRKAILDACRAWEPPPALGEPPEVITEPFTVMLWGITSDSVKKWLGGDDESTDIGGFAASPGVAEGKARVLTDGDQIGEIQDDEILVAPLTAPSWAPVFARIKATVTDSGGMMSHAAIVCREYGLPAVTGTGVATKKIRTGMNIRVDGNEGTVTILD